MQEDGKVPDARIEKIRQAFEKNGKILVTSGEFRGYTTFEEFKEFASASVRNRRRIATEILRKAVSEYPGEYDTEKHRRPQNAYLAFQGLKEWVEYNLPARFRHLPTNPTSVEERLRDYWLRADRHPPGLFGIEIEFATAQKVITEKVMYGKGVCQNGPECCPPLGPMEERTITRPAPPAVYRDIEKLIPGVRLKTDVSIHPDCSDAQEANLLAGPNGFERLKKLCSLIKERGGIINSTCAVHVHLDARKEERRVVGIRADKLWEFMPVMKDLVPDERLTSKYCVIQKPSFDNGRRVAINLQSYQTHKTIEVRLGSGSLNASKIWHWAHVLLLVSKSNKRYPSWEVFLGSDFPLILKVWCVRRANELRPNTKLMKSRINMIAPGLDAILKQDYEDENIDVSRSLKGENV